MELVEHRVLSRMEIVEDSDNRIKQNEKDERDDLMSDCDSETSEVLSVGSEPTPDSLGIDINDCETSRYTNETPSSRMDYQIDAQQIDESPLSRSPSPSSNDSGSCNPPQSPQSYCSPQQQRRQSSSSSPAPSSIRSPASSTATTSSPGRPDTLQEAIIPRYQTSILQQSHQQHLLLSRYSRESSDLNDYPIASRLTTLGFNNNTSNNDTSSFTNIERLHRVPISVPIVTRLSLSPPTATTVTGIQATTPAAMFNSTNRETLLLSHTSTTHPLLHQTTQVQHVPSTTLLHHHNSNHNTNNHHQLSSSHHNHSQSLQSQSHKTNQQHIQQHRLSINKLLQDSPVREQQQQPSSPISPGIRDDSESRRNNVTSPGNNLQINNNNNSHHRNNNVNNNVNINNNNNIQGNLKFSIDNILKADFGRRITDPMSFKKSRNKKIIQRPIDLTKDFIETSSESSDTRSETTTTTTTASPSSTPATNSGSTTTATTTATNGEQSKQNMLWPAWVYCTRYSDRPSSGKFNYKNY